MTDLQTETQRIVALWIERFGEPPPVIADPVLMQRILEQTSPRIAEDRAA